MKNENTTASVAAQKKKNAQMCASFEDKLLKAKNDYEMYKILEEVKVSLRSEINLNKLTIGDLRRTKKKVDIKLILELIKLTAKMVALLIRFAKESKTIYENAVKIRQAQINSYVIDDKTPALDFNEKEEADAIAEAINLRNLEDNLKLKDHGL